MTMSLIYEFNLDILKMYMYTKMKFLGQCFQKLDTEQDRQTDHHGQTRPNPLPAAFAVVPKFMRFWKTGVYRIVFPSDDVSSG